MTKLVELRQAKVMKSLSCCDRPIGDDAGLLPSIEETRRRALLLTSPVEGVGTIALGAARGRVAVDDVIAPLPLPPYGHSAVDGFALGSLGRPSYRIVSRIVAGADGRLRGLDDADAARIFTGAPLPEGTAAVTMQEHVLRSGDALVPQRAMRAGENIRRAGEDVRCGQVLVPSGSILDARHVAILAASGIASVTVRRPVRIALLSMGSELRDPGTALARAAIYDSNRWMLATLLQSPVARVTDLGILPDEPGAISERLREAGGNNDLVISSGGVSVGEEDYLKAALVAAGGAIDSWQMAIKPGKPVAVGTIGRSVYIGLPGNPLAAFVDFLLIARPVIQSLAGATPSPLQPLTAKAGFSWSRRPGRAEFFPVAAIGHVDGGGPVLDKLGKAGSARLKPLIEADGLGMVAAERTEITPGASIDWYPFTCSFSL